MKRYDDIDQLFRNRLRGDNQESSDWLTPPQFILDNATKILNERRKKRRRGFIILFFGIVITSFIAYQYVGFNTDHRANLEAPYSADQTLSELPVKETNLETGIGHKGIELISASEQSLIKNSGLFQQSPRRQSKANNAIDNTNKALNNNVPKVNNFATRTNNEKEIRVAKISKVEKPQAATPLRQIKQLKKIARVQESSLIWTRPIVNSLQNPVENNAPQNPKTILLYAFAGTNLSTLQMSNVAPADFELKEYDNFYLGYQFGLGSDYQISKRLSITGSVSFNSFLNKSRFTSNELYDKANEEQEPDGSISYKASFDINTPLTETSKDFILDVDDYSVQQDHILVNATEIKERINVLKTTLGVSYRLASLNKTSFALSAGLSANNVFKLNNHYKSTVLYEDKKMMEAEFKSEERAALKKFFLSSHVSAGVDYNINSKWSAVFNAGYERSIGSIRTQNASDPTQTMLESISLNVGLRHLF